MTGEIEKSLSIWISVRSSLRAPTCNRQRCSEGEKSGGFQIVMSTLKLSAEAPNERETSQLLLFFPPYYYVDRDEQMLISIKSIKVCD